MRIFFLTHRLPYAPNRGDRVRAHHELRALAAAGIEIHLFSLVHDEEEAGHAADLRDLCAGVHVGRVPRARNLLRALPALAGSRRTLTHVLLDSPELLPALGASFDAARPDAVLAYCSSMARFAFEPLLADVPLFLDMVDVDSAKWAELAKTARFPLNRIYAREARVLAAFEADAARRATATWVVNEREAEALRGIAGSAARIDVVENGVDVDYLRPTGPPEPSEEVVFCGVMNYAPNEDGASWLAERAWPAVRAVRPNARLLLVGTSPSARVLALGRRDPSVVVTGAVPDVRPFLWRGAVAAAPLLVARGIQNKVLEAVGAGLPAVVTPVVAAGLPPEVRPACRVAESPEDFAAALVDLLSGEPRQRRALAATAALGELKWSARLAPLVEALSRPPKDRSPQQGGCK